MKKMMTAFAACMIAGLVSAQVESANIVGYQTMTAGGQFYSSGATFISVGSSTGEWRLGDVTASGMNPDTDFIQFLSTTDANAEIYATYVDSATSQSYDETDNWVGWWDVGNGLGVGDSSLDDQTFSAGTGFLCNFTSSGVTLTYAGEVLQGSTTLDLSGQQFPMIANFTPVDLTLGDLTVSGMNPDTDFIQFLSTTDANAEIYATYVDSATSQSYDETDNWVGWWDVGNGLGVGDSSLDSQTFPAGTAVLGNFTSTGVQIMFPAAVE